VFDWLGADKQGVSCHLHPLKLVWGADGFDHDLNVCNKVADRLAAEPNYWASINLRGF
jgi:hypothetical protein